MKNAISRLLKLAFAAGFTAPSDLKSFDAKTRAALKLANDAAEAKRLARFAK